MTQSLQERYAPHNHCFGCGADNEKGLRIKSFVDGDEVICQWTAEAHHEAWTGVLNGGVCGVLFDCHSNWTAAYHLMKLRGCDTPPSTVTADFHVRLLAPTHTDGPLTLRAKVVESTPSRAVVEATLEARGRVTGTCRGTFVAVPEGHPAWHPW